MKSPWQTNVRVIVVVGADPCGVLYGVEEFNKKLAALFTRDLQPGELRANFDGLAEFSVSEAPGHREPGDLDVGLRHLRLPAFFGQHGRG